MAAGTAALPWSRRDAPLPDDSDHDLLLLSLTHDLKSPLGGLLLALDQLDSGVAGPLTPAQERLLGRARSAAHGMAILIGSTGEVAAQGPTLASVDRVFSLRDVLEDVRAATRQLMEDRQLYLRATIDRADHCRSNPLIFHRVLLNLVVNAITFTDGGGITITVGDDGNGTLVTEVIDTGVGLSGSRDLRNRPREDRGIPVMPSGIGLGICVRLLDLVGGTLSLRGNAGAGTTATFRLPLRCMS
ncbi:MAG: sensor histidine kinase [Gemmatimonas sp.]|jgi:signal transduction histidine kinase|uniref:sensor histidine kinase n=1 Tax=Gemmatimonas sp. TaxID=1962908 RepID=UPI0022C8754E|nr:HAMP domain-containing sensor histidine kinase [Gemmatimonas sp.]MCE2953006.1 HAMP domain-containing histidine kinase [Gemmatimonas sp.]MCZ8011741.1 HAMP domain-containing sensor histidine kinase [Gemmatimonas sp.]MCZ8265710.1 HAMP domain-containing sensor histidine kinase [Gemmatimonas sp.]